MGLDGKGKSACTRRWSRPRARTSARGRRRVRLARTRHTCVWGMGVCACAVGARRRLPPSRSLVPRPTPSAGRGEAYEIAGAGGWGKGRRRPAGGSRTRATAPRNATAADAWARPSRSRAVGGTRTPQPPRGGGYGRYVGGAEAVRIRGGGAGRERVPNTPRPARMRGVGSPPRADGCGGGGRAGERTARSSPCPGRGVRSTAIGGGLCVAGRAARPAPRRPQPHPAAVTGRDAHGGAGQGPSARASRAGASRGGAGACPHRGGPAPTGRGRERGERGALRTAVHPPPTAPHPSDAPVARGAVPAPRCVAGASPAGAGAAAESADAPLAMRRRRTRRGLRRTPRRGPPPRA